MIDPDACPLTGKTGYSYAEAARVAKRARRNRRDRVTAYRCARCRCWHVGHHTGELPLGPGKASRAPKPPRHGWAA